MQEPRKTLLTVLIFNKISYKDAGRLTRQFFRWRIEISAEIAWFLFDAGAMMILPLIMGIERNAMRLIE